MNKIAIIKIFCLSFIAFWMIQPLKGQRNTFCNPMNLDYGFKGSDEKARRTAADPVIVLFKSKYYLFTTNDRGGYRVSDDLIYWKNIKFDSSTTRKMLINGEPLAPAVAADDTYIYYINFGGPKVETEHCVDIFKTADPESGKWEVCGSVRHIADPTLFIDNGRFFVYHGLGADSPTQCLELDPKTMTEIPGSAKRLLNPISDLSKCKSGYYLGRREITYHLDASFLLNNKEMLPCPEGPWVVKNKDTYYLQIATPGTASQWYCDVVFISDNPTGPFIEAPYNPVSMKVGGFIGSAGHSCVFKDKYDNWWQIATMWIGVHQGFERRLGLFPVKFDEQGRMKVYTVLGDYPMVIPQRKFDPEEGYLSNWNVQSFKKEVNASSIYENYKPENASDEEVRTWWSAATGNKGEWMVIDLEKETTVCALQVNFAEQDVLLNASDETDCHAYILSYSNDGISWKVFVDKSKNKKALPHDYVVLDEPVKTRYIKLENIHTPKVGKFAVSDLRVFGLGDGQKPSQVKSLKVERIKSDMRFARIDWQEVKDADGYLIRFGYTPDFLNLCIQVKEKENTSLMTHILTEDIKYYWRIDTYNENGITEGIVTNENNL